VSGTIGEWTEATLAGRHVALIRGINVGRAKRVAMADLRRLLADLGYRDVLTLLNSGNVVFSGGRGKPGRIGDRIEVAMRERLGVSARVTVLTGAAFSTVVEENTLREGARDPARFLVAFCSEPDRLKELEPLGRQSWTPDALAVGSLAAYLWCASGILESRLAQAVGRVLGESTTARNWATVLKIQAVL
jgi:uncharacterized protein (DUF1697 family)